MSQGKKNLRLRRTQKLLRDALIELIEEQGFENLTVIELTERAMVSRAAFYRNYQDKYDLVEQIFTESMAMLSVTVSEVDSEEHPPQIWITFFEHIAADERLYGALLGRKGSRWFVSKMRAMLLDLLREYQSHPLWQQSDDHPIYPESDTMVPNLVVTMFIEAITWWLEHSRPYAPQEMARRCALLISAIFKETSTWQS